jgi:hypothetical protein
LKKIDGSHNHWLIPHVSLLHTDELTQMKRLILSYGRRRRRRRRSSQHDLATGEGSRQDPQSFNGKACHVQTMKLMGKGQRNSYLGQLQS